MKKRRKKKVDKDEKNVSAETPEVTEEDGEEEIIEEVVSEEVEAPEAEEGMVELDVTPLPEIIPSRRPTEEPENPPPVANDDSDDKFERFKKEIQSAVGSSLLSHEQTIDGKLHRLSDIVGELQESGIKRGKEICGRLEAIEKMFSANSNLTWFLENFNKFLNLVDKINLLYGMSFPEEGKSELESLKEALEEIREKIAPLEGLREELQTVLDKGQNDLGAIQTKAAKALDAKIEERLKPPVTLHDGKSPLTRPAVK